MYLLINLGVWIIYLFPAKELSNNLNNKVSKSFLGIGLIDQVVKNRQYGEQK